MSRELCFVMLRAARGGVARGTALLAAPGHCRRPGPHRAPTRDPAQLPLGIASCPHVTLWCASWQTSLGRAREQMRGEAFAVWSHLSRIRLWGFFSSFRGVNSFLRARRAGPSNPALPAPSLPANTLPTRSSLQRAFFSYQLLLRLLLPCALRAAHAHRTVYSTSRPSSAGPARPLRRASPRPAHPPLIRDPKSHSPFKSS